MVNKSKQTIVRDVMQKEIFTVSPEQSIFEASVLMAGKDIGTIPVVKHDGTLVGVLTDRDIVKRCNAVGKDLHKAKVCECMSANPIRTVPSATCADAMVLMGEYGIRRLPIVENDRLVGLISISDIAKVNTFCPNEKSSDETCILLDMAKELQKSSHLEHGCNFCHL